MSKKKINKKGKKKKKSAETEEPFLLMALMPGWGNPLSDLNGVICCWAVQKQQQHHD